MNPSTAPTSVRAAGAAHSDPQTAPVTRLGTLDIALALLLAALSLILYGRTLVPWLLPSDSGEFQVLAYQVGVAHTTGYPVYLLLGKLFISVVPFGDVAYRVNLYSAFMAAMAVALVYLATTLASRSRWGGLLAAVALTASFTFWSQALIAEVYAAGAAFLAAVLLALLLWERTGKAGALFAAGLLGGLGLGAHASVGVFGPAVIVFLPLHRARWRMLWRPALAGALAGLALYLITFLAVDLHAPPANIFNAAYGPARSAWGLSAADIANPVTRIIFVAGGRQWRTALYLNRLDMLKKIANYAVKLPREFSLLTLLLSVAGFVALIWRNWRVAVLLGLGLLVQWLFYFNYHVGDIYVFYIPGYMLLAILAGAGIGAVDRWLAARGQQVFAVLRPVALAALIVVAVWPVLAPRWSAVVAGEVPFLHEREYLVNSGTRALRGEADSTIAALPQNAIVFTDWNRLYPFYYAAFIDSHRSDLRFIEAQPRSESSGLALSVIEFVRSQIADHPMFSVSRINDLARAGFSFQPVTIGPTRMYRIEAP